MTRDPRLVEPGKEQKPEKALYNFAWFTAPGTAVLLAALASALLLRVNRKDIGWVLRRLVPEASSRPLRRAAGHRRSRPARIDP